jgi:hypothetical protein
MCNIILRDPTNHFWQLGCTEQGLLTTTLTNITFPINDPMLLVSNVAWTLTANAQGQIVSTKTTPSNIAQSFYVLNSPLNKTFKLTATLNGLLSTTFAPGQIEPIPYPFDISMSRWPDSTPVICPRCSNASIKVSADMSCWCCACNSFVLPEDTNIIVILDE